eukprot:TRINITY_DN2942_c0_g4_i1.p4 TRINITY_DN2942_c0_g4~~TRINITY_DN2942_c0_g4_i1.p4  ORF type:complete len:126 (-),score=30.90 TRINITY_DN2942_c0_g4_i1:785-1162(-)
MFRMKLSLPYLTWVFTPPGHHKEWALGIRVKATNELVGHANVVPVRASVGGTALDLAEGSFVAIKAEHRQRRLTPLIYREMIRRMRLRGVHQFYISTDRVLFAPFTEKWFYRRDLNFKKMYAVSV